MKATKLASIFAVTAVAAAVSTTTIAAEPVFSGDAGLNYNFEAEEAGSEGEVNIIIDTGVVYVDLDMGTGDAGDEGDHFILDEAYVTQGAVKFGDFDGSIATSAQYGAGVWEEAQDESGDVTDLGIQYSVTPELTVALEMVEGEGGFGFAAAYEADMDGLTLGLSGGSYTSEDDSVDATSFTLGVSADAGLATLIASFSTGEANESDFTSIIVGADLALSEELAVSAQYTSETESEVSDVEVTAYYTAGDVTYYATVLSGDSEEVTTVGAYASF